MDKFLNIFNQLNHEDRRNLNRPKTRDEIESLIKSFPTKRSQDLMASLTAKYFETFKEKLISLL